MKPTNTTKDRSTGFRKSIAETHPKIASQWHPTKNSSLSPTDVTAGTNKKAWWLCEKGHNWIAQVASRTAGSGCPKCYKQTQSELVRKAAVKKSGSLAKKSPELAAQWHPDKNGQLTPDHVSLGSSLKVWWVCERGHEWETLVKVRTRGHGCPYCRGQTSRLEVRFYCELTWIFGNTEWRKKINGIECDIYIYLK